MRTMVFDVPAENGGALSVLHEFYEKSKFDREKLLQLDYIQEELKNWENKR